MKKLCNHWTASIALVVCGGATTIGIREAVKYCDPVRFEQFEARVASHKATGHNDLNDGDIATPVMASMPNPATPAFN